MNLEAFRNKCFSFKGVTEGFPFDKSTLVFKVAGKMFALCDVDDFNSVNLKCDPERAISLREEYDAISAGYHMSKKHWNTVSVLHDLSDELIFELLQHSYDLVRASLPRKVQDELQD